MKLATPPYQYKVKFLITRKKIVITLFYAVFITSEEKVGNYVSNTRIMSHRQYHAVKRS